MPFDPMKLREQIKKSGIPAYRIAQMAENPLSTLSRLTQPGTSPNPSIRTLEKYCRILKCQVSDLLTPIKK